MFVKKFGFKGKLEELYDGPVMVREVGSKGLWIKVEGLENWQHLKNIKILRGGRMKDSTSIRI